MTKNKTITLAHGAGGRATSELIADVFLPHFPSAALAQLGDAAVLTDSIGPGERLAMTTDGTVVTPLFFSGADIGKLAVNGTVNDLAVSGARPLAITASFILDEGPDIDVLERVAASMGEAARMANVDIVAGDTKVVAHGAADRIFISTAGVGVIPVGRDLGAANLKAGDAIILSGDIGNHGAAIAIARGDLAIEADIPSDCAPLNRLTERMLQSGLSIRCMRDVTRGGLATVANEWARAGNLGIRLDELSIPMRNDVRGLCELVGLDPLYLANEGRVLVACSQKHAESLVATMRELPEAANAAVIGQVTKTRPNFVSMTTAFGGERMVDYMFGAQLPRIC